MRVLITLICVALIGCAAPRGPDSYRDTSRPISSMAVVETSRLDGSWHQVAGFGPTCRSPSPLRISEQGQRITGQGCALPLSGTQSLRWTAPGRFQLGTAELWLLWVDFDYRTLVIGTPDGTFGAILNRDGAIPADRLEAARRILSFNGYDLAKLTND